jgi:hypothetical protein
VVWCGVVLSGLSVGRFIGWFGFGFDFGVWGGLVGRSVVRPVDWLVGLGLGLGVGVWSGLVGRSVDWLVDYFYVVTELQMCLLTQTQKGKEI